METLNARTSQAVWPTTWASFSRPCLGRGRHRNHPGDWVERRRLARPTRTAFRAAHRPLWRRLFRLQGGCLGRCRAFAVVLHLLSVGKNRRVRVRCLPPTTNSRCWIPGRNLAERQLVRARSLRSLRHPLHGHPDLRRILTDYGFIGHPFRKDFPIRPCRNALRPGTEARRLRAGEHCPARGHAAHHPRRELRRDRSWLKFAITRLILCLRPAFGLNVRCAHVSLRRS